MILTVTFLAISLDPDQLVKIVAKNEYCWHHRRRGHCQDAACSRQRGPHGTLELVGAIRPRNNRRRRARLIDFDSIRRKVACALPEWRSIDR
jgi:hypothetical protein